MSQLALIDVGEIWRLKILPQIKVKVVATPKVTPGSDKFCVEFDIVNLQPEFGSASFVDTPVTIRWPYKFFVEAFTYIHSMEVEETGDEH